MRLEVDRERAISEPAAERRDRSAEDQIVGPSVYRPGDERRRCNRVEPYDRVSFVGVRVVAGYPVEVPREECGFALFIERDLGSGALQRIRPRLRRSGRRREDRVRAALDLRVRALQIVEEYPGRDPVDHEVVHAQQEPR